MSEAGPPGSSGESGKGEGSASGDTQALGGVDLATAAERLSLIQQMYQQKQQELLNSYEQAKRAIAAQQFQAYYQQLLAAASAGQQPRQERMDESEGPAIPIQLTSSMTSLLGSPGSQSVPQTPTTSKDPKENPLAVHNRNVKNDIRQTLGGSQTISQHTKDRLKNMIANRRAGDSNPNLVNGPVLNGSTGASSSGIPTWPNNPLPQPQPMSPQVGKSNVSSPHFEPYPVQSTHHNNTAHLPEYQLRKVNSEPNLKMRIRSKILSKGNSPIQHLNNSPNHPTTLQRADSDVGSTLPKVEESLLNAAAVSQAFVPHMILPSPSLPNLNLAAGTLGGPGGIDMSSLLAQAAQLNSFLSLPSLLKTQLAMSGGQMGIVTGQGGQADEQDRAKLDPRAAALASLTSAQLPIGGYPSLLKQQLRELVLRRKSLVREEPEEAALMEDHTPALLKTASVETVEAREDRPATGLAYDGAMSRHECVCGQSASHVEHGGRVTMIWERLQNVGLVQRCERVPAKKASLEALRAVHSATYVTFFAVSPTACLKMEPSELPLRSFVQLPCGGIGVDSDTYFNDASTQNAARTAAGSLIELATQVAEGKLRNGFACIRPPGHHAEKDQAMGFCFFNNVAVTVRHLQQKFPQRCKRIAIVDWDVHHGNGTQLCFESDPSVLYISMHRHDNGNFFPGTGAVTEVGSGAGKGYTVNIPFSGAVMRDADYLAAWRVIVAPVLNHYEPTFILVSAGFDACTGHPNALGGYEISAAMFGFMTRQLLQYADGRLVLALEGGYEMNATSDAVEHCVKVLLRSDEDAGRLSTEALEGIPCLNAQETIQKVIAIHKKHWPTLTAIQGINTSELQWQNLSRELQNMSMQS
ncbi:unnamed protein product, partial [Mesorhabditis belari]|uniref:histone deacetylase n=1 Tax=Mesorhabditis belari TaxID=2138241 RepID=A0AAF3ECI9_9BILA